jgi:hypothetical protein
MNDQTTMKRLPGTKFWFSVFGLFGLILLIVLPVLTVLSLYNFGFYLLNAGSATKLIFFLLVVYSSFGFLFLSLKMWEYWDSRFMLHQIIKYKSTPKEKAVTFELLIPPNYHYDPSILTGFFYFLGNIFRSSNITRNIQYNYGRCTSDITFDFIAQNGQLRTYITFPFKKINQVQEAFKRFFPQIQLQQIDNPYSNWPKEWDSKLGVEGFHDLIGFSIGNSKSNIYPTLMPATMDINKMPMDMLMLAFRDLFPNQKVIFQQIFKFDTNNAITDNPLAKTEFDQFRQDIFDQYAPFNDRKEKDQHAFGVLMPNMTTTLSNIARHFEVAYPTYSYKIIVFCKDEQESAQLVKNVEKIVTAYTDSVGDFFGSNYISLQYITSNKQQYRGINSIPPQAKSVFDTFVYPNQFSPQIESIFAQLYQKYFYPNENRYRSKVNYSGLTRRDADIAWFANWNLTSPLSIPAWFQLPSRSVSKTKTAVDKLNKFDLSIIKPLRITLKKYLTN